MEKIIFGLIGAGGLGREVMPYVRESISKSLNIANFEIEIYFVETWEPELKQINHYPLISLENFLSLSGIKYFNIAVGDTYARDKILNKINNQAQLLSIFSPHALILDNTFIDGGAILSPYTVITSNTTIGKCFYANVFSYVAHDCIVGDFVTFAAGVRCNGNVHIDDYAYIGAGVIIREGSKEKPMKIGRGAILGMGAIVTKNVAAGEIVVGNPARPLIKAS